MKPDIPFRQCASCEFIEDCPHPSVSDKGSPEPPDECIKKDKVILTQRTQTLQQKP